MSQQQPHTERIKHDLTEGLISSSAPAQVTIRRAGLSDWGLLLAFHHALYVGHSQTILTMELAPLYAYRDLEATIRDDIDAMLQNPSSIVLIAQRSEDAMGYITGYIDDDPRLVFARRGMVEDWYVRPEARGQGVGRLLLRMLVESFKESGCQVVESSTWWGNQGARKAHENLGFRAIEIRYGMQVPSG